MPIAMRQRRSSVLSGSESSEPGSAGFRQSLDSLISPVQGILEDSDESGSDDGDNRRCNGTI